MTSLNDTAFPDIGLAIVFSPTNPGEYSVEARFCAGEEMDIEDLKFYMALGQGIMYLCSEQVQDVVGVGAKIIMANHEPETETTKETGTLENTDIPQELAAIEPDNVVPFKKSK